MSEQNFELKRKAKRGKEKSRVWQLKIQVLFLRKLRCFDNFAAFDTAGANLLPLVAAGRHLDADGLQIRVKTSARFIVRV